MARRIQAASGQRGISLDDAVVLHGGDIVVVSDEQFSRLSALVSNGTLLDLGTTTADITDGPGKAVPGVDVSTLSATFAGRLEPASYTYNPDGTVATETVGGFTTTYAYNADGTVHTATRNGVTLTYSYDASGNVQAVA